MSYIDRRLIKELADWHVGVDRKPLLIRGARQVGKSWAVKKWCKQFELQLVEINFEERPNLASIFEQDLNVDRIINDISAAFGISLRTPRVVLFLDEIQLAPKAITALRYFYEKVPELAVVAAGSLVEFVLEEHGLPVGRVQSHFAYPLSFLEFLRALNKPGLAHAIESFSVSDPVPFSDFIHTEILSMLRLYFRIGGMPKVVSSYLRTSDMIEVSREQGMLVRGYSDDFRKYARRADWALLQIIFDKMGALAGGAQVKFSAIDPQAKSSQVRRALTALQHALLVHKIQPTHTQKLPLAAHAVDKRFKLSFLDIGLLHYMMGFDWNLLSQDADLTDVGEGRFAEQFVAQELITARTGVDNYPLHYWDRPKSGSEAEVDFIVEFGGAPVPIEVKSGKKGRLKSLELYMNEMRPAHAFVLSQRNVETMGAITFLPLYLAAWLRR